MTATLRRMMLPREDLRVLVTGASGGLGKALCALLVEAGCRVAGIDIAAGGDFPGDKLLSADLSDPGAAAEAVREASEAVEGLDAVVCAAAIVDSIHRAERFPVRQWRTDIDVNLNAQFYVLQAAYPALAASGDGRVVLISSMAGMDGLPGQAAYAASKGGVLGLTRTLAAEWAAEGITVNAVVPGVFHTSKVDAMPETTKGRLRQQIPLGRFGTESEVCATILFLLSSGGAYCHGGVYRVDGGIGLFTGGFFR